LLFSSAFFLHGPWCANQPMTDIISTYHSSSCQWINFCRTSDISWCSSNCPCCAVVCAGTTPHPWHSGISR
jgi:hypothetical protein